MDSFGNEVELWSERVRRFYQSARWGRLRNIVLEDANYVCQRCGCIASKLEVHHVEFLTPGNIDDPNVALNQDNLIALCHQCHDTMHQRFGQGQRRQIVYDEIGNVVDCHERGHLDTYALRNREPSADKV